MPRILAINPDAGKLRYVIAEGNRNGRLRLQSCGCRDAAADAASQSEQIRSLITELKCERGRLLMLISRGAVDSATFAVPPASDDELPELVRNLSLREIPGVNDATPIDFVAYPPQEEGGRIVTAMAVSPEVQQLLDQVLQSGKIRSAVASVSTHFLGRFLADDVTESVAADSVSSAMVVAVGGEFAELSVVGNGLPLTSRRIRLSADAGVPELCQHIAAEIQRTMLALRGSMLQPSTPVPFILVGNPAVLEALRDVLEAHFEEPIRTLAVDALLDETPAELAAEIQTGDYLSLLAAVSNDCLGIAAPVDFASPKKPVEKRSFSPKMLAAAAAVLLFAGTTFWTVRADFIALDEEQVRLEARLGELNELLSDTEERRQLVSYLSSWEDNRISWPDELRDLTSKIPSSPVIRIDQLSVSPAGSGTAVASFRGTAIPPEQIAVMENNLRDEWHSIRIPGIREQLVNRKITASFQATLTIKRRAPDQYEFAPKTTADSDSEGGAGQ